MQRLTAQRVNGIKTGYWSAAKKDELIQRLGELEDDAERSERRGTQASGWIDPAEQLPEVFQFICIDGVEIVKREIDGRLQSEEVDEDA